MITRKNALTLTPGERKGFVDALLALKKSGVYGGFVKTHMDSMMKIRAFANEPQDMDYRNAAHSGPVFLPWHRKLLLEFESALQKVDPAVSIPYWDWASDSRLARPATSPIWQPDFFGGDGTGANNAVETGPFAHS